MPDLPRLVGALRVPGDKSMSHRALILAGMAGSESTVSGLPDGLDVLSTRRCLERLGVVFDGTGRALRVRPPRDWTPGAMLDAGNSGTTARLLAGALVARRCTATITGDESLSRRPMERVAEPLRRLEASIELTEGRLPLRVGFASLAPARWEATLPSAQVKSAFLLAALGAGGESCYRETVPTRDHLERLMPLFGVPVRCDEDGTVRVRGGLRPRGARVAIPGDPSSAAVPITAAALLPGSEITVEGVMLNPLRLGFVEVLTRMGASISVDVDRSLAGPETVGSITARGANDLQPVHVTADEVPGIIDELPLLVMAAAFTRGESRFDGLAELRVKESDRLDAIIDLLEALSVPHELEIDSLVLRGDPGVRLSRTLDARGDHRLALLHAVLALRAPGNSFEPEACVAVSWPGFYDRFGSLVSRASVPSR